MVNTSFWRIQIEDEREGAVAEREMKTGNPQRGRDTPSPGISTNHISLAD